jgi:protein associated with RNAse G/E
MKIIKVIKQDYLGRSVWEYSGNLLERVDNRIVIEAYFDREDTLVDELILREGDKFTEIYYLDKWFNIYEIRDQQEDSIKAWYCNISFPVEISGNILTYRDLELDLLVYPDGTQIVLDVEEFESLPLSSQDYTSAIQALSELQEMFSSKYRNFLSTQ